MPYSAVYAAAYPLDTPEGTGGYPEVYPWLRTLLQDNAPATGEGAIADEYFDPTIKSAIRGSIAKAAIAAAGLADSRAFYMSLAGDDLDVFSEAVGHLVAARLLIPLSTGGANGQLLSEKTEQVARTFANEPGSKAEWEARAKELLAELSFAPVEESYELPSLYDVAGPSRGRATSWRGDWS